MKLIIFIFFLIGLFLICAMQTISAQTKVVGEYYKHTIGGGCKVTLKENGKYKQNMKDCTWGFITEGSWSNRNDTIYLNATKIFDRHKKAIKFDSTNVRFDSYFSMRKFLLKGDTLFIVYQNKLKWPLIRQKEIKKK